MIFTAIEHKEHRRYLLVPFAATDHIIVSICPFALFALCCGNSKPQLLFAAGVSTGILKP